MASISKHEADAWDRVLDAAAELADLIQSRRFAIAEDDLEDLTIFIAANSPMIRRMFRRLKRTWPG